MLLAAAKPTIAVSVLLLLLGTRTVMADPNDSLMINYAQNGAHQVDVEFGSQKPSGQSPSGATTLGVGASVTERWFTEVYGTYLRDSGDTTKFDSAAWINTLLLTDGQSPIEFALYTEIEYERDRAAGYKAVIGPLLQGEFGLTTVNLNFLLHRNYLADFSNPMQLDYQWQVKRRLSASYEFGVQGFGELGAWNHWAPHDQQVHQIGPVFLGKFKLGDEQVIHYNAAVLFDVLDGQRATTFRLQAVYGF
ncbi:MAG TPA: hypothetical protein VIF60_01340 [Burkholderiaceae bacterium]